MQLISIFSAFECFERKRNTACENFEYFEINQSQVTSWKFFLKQTRPPFLAQLLPALSWISVSYACLQSIPLLLMPRGMLFFLCFPSLCRLGLQAPELPGAAMQTPLGRGPTGRTPHC
jgi:hypothetical protein